MTPPGSAGVPPANTVSEALPRPLPLKGVRVVDLSWVFAIPYAGAYLADLGAEVIKVDSHHDQFMDTTRTITGPFPDNDPGWPHWERGGTFHTLNRGKLSLAVDLRAEEAQTLVKELVGVSDVVLENFTPRVMRRFCLDYASLRLYRPDLIMVSNTGFGHSGPWSNFGAMASSLEPTHGTGAYMGYLDTDPEGRGVPGSVPNKMGNSYTDFLATWTALGAVLASLLYRARTGRGVWTDLAMYQVGAAFIGEGLLDFSYNGRRAKRIGNRHDFIVPHGCYPCQGHDEWVTLAVRDDAEWNSFRGILERTTESRDIGQEKFATPLSRLEHQDELDEVISRWTSTRGQYQVMETLQAAGIPAGPVLNARGLLVDPHFRAREFFESVEHPKATGLGRREYIGRGWKLSGNDLSMKGPAPLLGEDNRYLLGEVLGLSSSKIDALYQEGLVGDSLVGGQPPSVAPLDRQVELGWMVEASLDTRQE